MSTSPDDPTNNFLPDDLLWADGGHASDIVLTALSDGQNAIVPPVVRAHVDRCPTCVTHLGHAVLLTLHTDQQFATKAEHDRVLVQANAKRPLPRLAIALGLGVAILGLVPSFFDGEASRAQTFVTRDVPLFLKGLGTLGRHLNAEPGSAASLVVTYFAAALLVAMGIGVARLMPQRLKKETSKS